MSERRQDEKAEEKRGEKEEEKHAEKEGSWDEKWHRDPVRTMTIAIILIWGGIVALVGNFATPSWWHGWEIFLIGTGVIVLVKAGIRLMPAYRRPAGGSFIIGMIILGIGLGGLLGWSYVWPVVLIAVALVIIFRGLAGRK
jgi:hypothetical protein